MNLRKHFVQILIFIFLVGLVGGCEQDRIPSKLTDFKAKIDLATAQKVSMFSLVRQALKLYPDMERALQIPQDPGLPKICDAEIFVTIFHEASPQITGVGQKGCTQERLLRAVAGLTGNPDFQKFYMLNLDSTTIKIDVLYRRSQMTEKRIRKGLFEPGVDGLILEDEDSLFYELPTDYIHFGWEPAKQGKGIMKERFDKVMDLLCRHANYSENSWKTLPVHKFRTKSFIQHRPDYLPLPLFRGNIMQTNYSSADMARSAAGIGDWLIGHIEPTGRFTYYMNPANGQGASFFVYGMPQHAGCVYALLHFYNQSLEPRFLEKGVVAMNFLERNLESPLLEPDLLAVKHPVYGTAQLSSTALTLLALCELPEAHFAQVGLDVSNRLARFLLKMQMDDGNFYSHYMYKLAGIPPEKPERFIQGQTLLALTRYFGKNPNVEWISAARQSAEAQMKEYEKTGRPDEWTLQGLAELYKLDPDPRFARTVLKMADQLLEGQYKEYKYPDYVGGFKTSRPPKTLSTARRAEALFAASNMCKNMGGNDCEKYDDAVLLAARFLIWNQYKEENTYFIGLPDTVEGAIKSGLIDEGIRIDNCHYALNALIGAYDIASEKEKQMSQKQGAPGQSPQNTDNSSKK